MEIRISCFLFPVSCLEFSVWSLEFGVQKMATIKRFEDIGAWQKARGLSKGGNQEADRGVQDLGKRQEGFRKRFMLLLISGNFQKIMS